MDPAVPLRHGEAIQVAENVHTPEMAANANVSATQLLDFNQAMSDFKTMFPGMERDVIETVLRANGGAVDATLDQLLQLSVDTSDTSRLAAQSAAESQSSQQRNRGEFETRSTPPPSYQQASSVMSDHLAYHNKRNLSEDSLAFKCKWQPAILAPLPDHFLRITLDENQLKMASMSRRQPQSRLTGLSRQVLEERMRENERQRTLSRQKSCDVGAEAHREEEREVNQFLEDERIAIMMQNEEFLRYLQQNPEFMSTLELDGGSRRGASHFSESRPYSAPHGVGRMTTSAKSMDGGGAQSSAGPSWDTEAFRASLRNMGKTSRKKFAHLAKLFSGRKKNSTYEHHLLDDGSDSVGDPSREGDDTSGRGGAGREKANKYHHV